MEWLLRVGLANAVMAAALALLAAAVGRWSRRPALVGSLWALVLLKLLTPTVWHVDLGWRSPPETPPTSSAFAGVREPTEALGLSDRIIPGEIAVAAEVDAEVSEDAYAYESGAPAAVTLPPPPTVGEKPRAASKTWLIRAAVFAWAGGSLVCAVVIVVRVARFRKLLRCAEPGPPALRERIASLAGRMGIRAAPTVCFVPGVVCPLLWPGLRGARVLVPRELWDRLDAEQQSSLLAHELAHLRRRDHWVRLLELLATVMYWWFPVTWWARARMREAEEQCCDAWVVWALPGRGRDYAGALLETVEFVSREGGVRRGVFGSPAVPLLASGMGQFHQLARRLTMIKSEAVPRKLSWLGRAAVCALAVGWLPLAPARGQAATPAAEPPDVPAVAAPPAPIAATTPPAAPALAPVGPVAPALATPPQVPLPPLGVPSLAAAPAAAPPAISRGKDDDDDDVADDDANEKKKASVIEDLKRNKVEKASGEKREKAEGAEKPEKVEARSRELEAARAQVNALAKQLDSARRRVVELEARLEARKTAYVRTNGGTLKIVETDPKTGRIISEKVVSADNSATFSAKSSSTPEINDYKPRPGAMPTPHMPQNTLKGPAIGNMPREQRLAAIESNLKALLDEVNALKEEDRRRWPGAENPGTAPRQ